MKAIAIKTESGGIIEIERNNEGAIFIRHSQFKPREWSELHEYDAADVDGCVPKIGGYVTIDGREFQIGTSELSAIKNALDKHAASDPTLVDVAIPDDERQATNELVSLVLTIQKYLATYGQMIEEISQRRQSFLSPVQQENVHAVVEQISDAEEQLELLRRKVEW